MDAANREALQAAWQDAINRLKTEPMTAKSLRRYFPKVGRDKMPVVLKAAGAERIGNYWRVPITTMPPTYWRERGLWPNAE